MAEILAASLFALGYLAIALEHRFFISKAASALLLAVVLWVLTALTLPSTVVQHFLEEASVDIFGIMVFLLSAMTLVEILVHYNFFDFIERWLRERNFNLYYMGWAITTLSFFLSAFLDNLTTTIVMIQISRRLFPREHLFTVAALIVVAANAGGAFSPIGDVTTIMLWFAEKFTALEVITQGFIPSFLLAMVAGVFMLRRIPASPLPAGEMSKDFKPSRSDRIIIAVTLISFLLPLVASLMDLPPYLGLLAGLAGVWFLIDLAKQVRPQQTHLEARIKNFLQKTDIESIQFFLGILLSVAALHALGLLDFLTDALLGGEAPAFSRMVGAFTGLGLGSAIIDNVPLTAAAISALEGVSASLWVLLALTVGTGGSILVIGSAAGVVAMGMVPELTFTKYLKIASVPALIGFLLAVGAWIVQYQLFFT